VRPDAIKLPGAMMEQLRQERRLKFQRRTLAAADLAEELLQVDRPAGERAYVRTRSKDGFHFASRSPYDLLAFPTGHDLEGKPRYRWERHENGIEFGYLVEAAQT
jgi:hypothetical protein